MELNLKLLWSNGRVLEVRPVGDVVYRLEARRIPIKLHGNHVLEDDEARELCRQLSAAQEEK